MQIPEQFCVLFCRFRRISIEELAPKDQPQNVVLARNAQKGALFWGIFKRNLNQHGALAKSN